MRFKNLYFIFSMSFLFLGCATMGNHSAFVDFRNGSGRMKITHVEVDVNGFENPVVLEQSYSIAQSLLKSISVPSKKNYEVSIKLFDESYFSDAAFIHSLFVSLRIYDGENEEVAVVSDYSTGKESLQSPEVQEKFLRRCISKIKEMEL